VGHGIDDAVWDHSEFSKNRNGLLERDVASKFMAAVLPQHDVKQLLSTDRCRKLPHGTTRDQRAVAHHPERDPPLGHQRTNHSSSWICSEPGHPKAIRRGLWLDEDHRRWLREDEVPRARKSPMGFRPRTKTQNGNPENLGNNSYFFNSLPVR
jgi:hypothetical protein